MLSKILSPGDRLELLRVASEEKKNRFLEQNSVESKVLLSQIYDMMDDEQLKIAMPIVEGRVIPLPVNARYDVCFFTSGGLYKSRVVITDRYKEDGLYILVVELMSDLKKFQRRQYFRLECTLDIEYRQLEDSDVHKIKEDPELIRDIIEKEPFTAAIVLDISGGGVRFASEEKLEPDTNILVDLNISTESGQKVYGVMAKVLSSSRIINKEHMYEQRVEYLEIAGHTREAIIKFIFEQERRLRKK